MARSTTHVISVWPLRELLPENLLRFYVSFSAPMSRGEAYRRIKLIDTSTGKLVDAPFLELDEELWSPDGTRFTLLFDPGRIKRGLRPREEVGPVLEEGKTYSLLIETDWPDAAGNPLVSPFSKELSRLAHPTLLRRTQRTGKSASLGQHTRAPHGSIPRIPRSRLLDRLIFVQDAREPVVPGQIAVGESETVWWFTPLDAWKAGEYSLKIGAELEDVGRQQRGSAVRG